MTDEVSDLLHAQYRLSLLQWNAGTARRQPTQLVTAMCGAFNVVLLQEGADHVPHVSDQFTTYTDGDNLAILLNKDTFLPGAIKYPISEESTSKTTWGLKALVVRGHLRRLPIGASKTITLCTVHLHNVVAKKRDAATALLQRLHLHMQRLEVEFIGGDFNRAAKRHHCRSVQRSRIHGPGIGTALGRGWPGRRRHRLYRIPVHAPSPVQLAHQANTELYTFCQ